MINPNGDDFTKSNPLPAPMNPEEPMLPGTPSRFQETSDKVSAAAGDAWRQTRATANTARERTEFFLRENPVPTVIGALAIGLAIGLAIRYSSETSAREAEVKSPFGNVNLGVLSLPFLWPFMKQMRRRYEDSADAMKDAADKIKNVDVDRYVKPLRKKWRSWTN